MRIPYSVAVVLSPLVVPAVALAQDGAGQANTSEKRDMEPSAETIVESANAPRWVLACNEPRPTHACAIIQNLASGPQQQRVLTVGVRHSPFKGHLMTIALPHGILFPAGVRMQVDDGPELRMVVQSSDATGAYTGMAIDAALLAAMESGSVLNISFSSNRAQRINIPVSLKNFRSALEELAEVPRPPAPNSAEATPKFPKG